jgi:hypothetical protein
MAEPDKDAPKSESKTDKKPVNSYVNDPRFNNITEQVIGSGFAIIGGIGKQTSKSDTEEKP